MASLEAWIEDLRGRLDRGELAGRGPVMLRDGSWLPDIELAVKIMLADLTHIEALMAERRQGIRDDFQHLREQLAS